MMAGKPSDALNRSYFGDQIYKFFDKGYIDIEKSDEHQDDYFNKLTVGSIYLR